MRDDAIMRPVPSHIVKFLEVEFPQFVKAVGHSEEEVVLQWATFSDDPDLLFNCVWYALCLDKTVVIEPPI